MANRSLPKPSNSINTCSVESCERSIEARGLCARHYMRQRIHGDPNFTKTNVGTGETAIARFWSKVAITADDEKCWNWQGQPDTKGYGILGYEGKKRRAHRFAWFATYNEWPPLHLLHRCDNKLCVNPKHLRIGTDADNAQDRVERGQQPRGEGIWASKLTENDVLEIRHLLTSGIPGRQIAMQFGVSSDAINCVKLGKTWRHVH